VLAASLFSIIACTERGSPEVTTLDLEVRVGPTSVVLHARERQRPCTCTWGEWPDVGDCVTWSDSLSCTCDPQPATCVDSIRVERDGVSVAERHYGGDFGGEDHLQVVPLLGTSGNVLFVDGCGGLAEIPLDITAPPMPVIEGIDDDGDELRLQWSASPAGASALVTMSDGFVVDACHPAMGATGEASFVSVSGYSEQVLVGVHAFAAPVAHDTELGPARVWAGGIADETLVGL